MCIFLCLYNATDASIVYNFISIRKERRDTNKTKLRNQKQFKKFNAQVHRESNRVN